MAIGEYAAQDLIDDAAEVGITAEQLGEWSGWGADYLHQMSRRDETSCRRRIDEQQARNRNQVRALEQQRRGEPMATGRQVDYILDLLRQRHLNGDGDGWMTGGPTARDEIALLTRTEASNYITSLKGDY